MKKKEHKIWQILPGSIAEEMDLQVGDAILSINGEEMEDIFDYDFLCQDEFLEVLIRTVDGQEELLEIEKEEDEDLGIRFENGLMDEYRSCRNKCMFCFIDQMPPGMRETLYFKDDDSRLSFLQGNYVTLTNMSEKDINRIIRYHLAPINISVHTMNPELRCKMLHNRFAGEALKKIDMLYEAGTEMNGQIVMCPGLNDGAELEYTIEKLGSYLPFMKSVSVVPVGLTKFRDNLYPLTLVTKEIAEHTIDTIERWQKIFYEQYGLHFIHASDEFYILADREMPEEERYDGYIQLENGVGFIRLLFNEFEEALSHVEGDDREYELSLATGKLMGPYMQKLADLFSEKFPKVKIHIYAIRNDFFGENITVSGLITGQDLMAQLQGKPLGDYLMLPQNMLRIGEDVFLDDFTLSEVEEKLDIPICIVPTDGADVLKIWMKEGSSEMDVDYLAYENEDVLKGYDSESDEDLEDYEEFGRNEEDFPLDPIE